VKRDIEIELIADRKRDEAAKALRKTQKNSKSDDVDALALHAVHGLG
jgi:hypothetical protein